MPTYGNPASGGVKPSDSLYLTDMNATAEAIYVSLKEKLSDIVPAAELEIKAELAERINVLKREKNAIILGHNYMEAALFN